MSQLRTSFLKLTLALMVMTTLFTVSIPMASAQTTSSPSISAVAARPTMYVDWGCVEYDINVTFTQFPSWWRNALRWSLRRSNNPYAAAAAFGLAAPVIVAIYNDCKR